MPIYQDFLEAFFLDSRLQALLTTHFVLPLLIPTNYYLRINSLSILSGRHLLRLFPSDYHSIFLAEFLRELSFEFFLSFSFVMREIDT